MILYLTTRAELDALASDQTISFPASMLDERLPFCDAVEIAQRRRKKRRAEREGKA